jgi:hypothetical protein
VSKVVVQVNENPVSVTVDNSNISLNVTETPVTVTLGTSGPQGPQGEPGAPGEVLYSDLSYVHIQSVAQSTWNITHGLQFVPNITVIDSAGTVVEGSYEYPNNNSVVLTFSSPFSGKAYLS